MSGLDPLAALASAAVANAQAAIEESTLNLGALLSDFQAQLSVGDVVRATVLPPQNGSDRLSLLGQTIAAQLPPGIDPGETIALQVTGFTNTAVIVRNLGTVEPDAPLPAPPTPAESSPSGPSPQRAILRSVPPAPAGAAPAAQPPRPVAPPAPRVAPGPLAPPREVFVQATVRPNVQSPPPVVQSAESETKAAPDLEARLAATRASTTIGSAASKAAAAPLKNATTPSARPTVESHAAAQAAITRARPDQTAPAPPPSPQAALLTRLRVPLTPVTLAAAKAVDVAARSLTTAFEKLDAQLVKAPPDARISTLRSALAFVSRLDLRNTTALPEQIASYVSHVVSSAESKIAQLVAIWTQGVAQEAVEQETLPQPSAAQFPAGAPRATLDVLPSLVAPSQTPAHASVSPAVAAHAAERGVALEHDVKSMLMQLVANPPQGSSAQLVTALRDALTATTAVQLNVLNTQNNDPQTITIPLPAYFYEGGQPAQLRISRDAPGGKNAMDADNFHVAFILDTKSMGTVAIDVQTVGRSISLDVKTESPRAADRFRTSFTDLRSRLEQLHYRISTMAAGLAPRGAVPSTPATPVSRAERTSNVDMQA